MQAGVLSLGCGVVLALAFDPVGWGLLAPVALAVCFSRARHAASVRTAALYGALFGSAFLGVHMWWLVDSIGGLAWVALTLVEAAWFALACAAVSWCRAQALWPFTAAALWTAVEILRQSWPFGGMPWGQLGVTALDTPLQAVLPYLGVTGTTFLIALAAATGAQLADRRSAATWAGVGVVASVVLVASLPRPGSEVQAAAGAPHQPPAEAKVVALVQSGVPGSGRDVPAHRVDILDSSLALTRALSARPSQSALGAPDLVIWAEGAAGSSPADDPFARARIAAASRAVGAPILVGSINAGPTPSTRYNQGVVWTESGPGRARYTKLHPVPFGEFIPARNVLGGISSQLDQIPYDMVPGPPPEPMRVADMSIANAICFDIAYAGQIRDQVLAGAELIVVQTSNATFSGTTQPQQQLAITRARALETQRVVLVTSLNGITAAIGADGAVLDELAPDAVTTSMVSVVPSDHLTVAVRIGARLSDATLVLAGLAMILELAGRMTRQAGRAGVT